MAAPTAEQLAEAKVIIDQMEEQMIRLAANAAIRIWDEVGCGLPDEWLDTLDIRVHEDYIIGFALGLQETKQTVSG